MNYRGTRRGCVKITVAVVCAAVLLTCPALAKDKKVVLLAGKKSHGAGEHEYEKGMNLFKHCLDTSLSVRGVVVEVHTNGWPEDEKTLGDADTIVIFSDGSGKHPFLLDDRMAVITKQMNRGCGLVVIHWSLNLPSKIGNESKDSEAGCGASVSLPAATPALYANASPRKRALTTIRVLQCFILPSVASHY